MSSPDAITTLLVAVLLLLLLGLGLTDDPWWNGFWSGITTIMAPSIAYLVWSMWEAPDGQ